MANAMRFTTVELSELEDRIRSAADKALALELNLFADLVREVTARAGEIAPAANAMAALDLAAALAELAVEGDYVRPMVDSSAAFAIKGGRHPVVEAMLKTSGTSFVANDCKLASDDDATQLWLITGPNMAGKSTFLRQNALIALLAQMGSFVPGDVGAHRRYRPAVLPGRRCRRPGARAFHVHGRNGRDRGDPQPGDRALLGHPR